MEKPQKVSINRRLFLRMCLMMPAPFVLASWGKQLLPDPISDAVAQQASATPTRVPPSLTPAPTSTPILAPTPVCGDDDDDDITLAQTEGPYYKARSPERTSLLEPGMKGTRMIVTGYVLSTDCKPIAKALVDFWHANDDGEYDNVGYTLRGHQFTDDDGRYYLETIVPGLYPGRTRHFHVKVQAPNQRALTTQLYFPDEPANRTDGIFNSALVMDVEDTDEGKAGFFNFVLKLV